MSDPDLNLAAAKVIAPDWVYHTRMPEVADRTDNYFVTMFGGMMWIREDGKDIRRWSPATDIGDAMRLVAHSVAWQLNKRNDGEREPWYEATVQIGATLGEATALEPARALTMAAVAAAEA